MQAVQSIEIDAPIEFVYACIADYASYPQILESVSSCQVRRREERLFEVQMTVTYLRSFRFTIAVQEEPPHFLWWRLVGGDLKSNSGSWELTRVGPELTLARYACVLEFHSLVPAEISRILVQVSLPDLLESFKSWIEKKYAASFEEPEP